MGKGPTRHMKRELSPSFWPIHRKEKVFAVKTAPGPHPLKESLPILVIVRDILAYARTEKEAKMLIKQGKILVDGSPRSEEDFPVGAMDVVEIPDSKQVFRALPDKRGGIKLHPIRGSETSFKLCRIMGKTTLKGGKTQLNLHDGRNVALSEGGDKYEVYDVLQMRIPESEVTDHIRFDRGVQAVVTGGRSRGGYGTLTEMGSEPGIKRTATLRTSEGEEIRTLAKYVFAVGSKEPLISMAGGS